MNAPLYEVHSPLEPPLPSGINRQEPAGKIQLIDY
jgi:hypothetical protein